MTEVLFPELLPEETLHSAVSRFHEMMGFATERTTLRRLLGSESVSLCVELPGRLDTLLRNLPASGKYTRRELLDSHTNLRFYSAFLPAEAVADAEERMRLGGSGSVHVLLGRAQSRVRRPEHLRYCQDCVQEDLDGRHGEPYWRRVHQIGGVLVCPAHGTPLLELISTRRSAHRGPITSLRSALGGEAREVISKSDSSLALLHALALDAQWILTHDVRHESYAALWVRMRSWCASVGWCGLRRTRVQWGRVLELALERIGEATLCKIAGSELPPPDWHTLFSQVKSRYASPTIVRLLVLRLADVSAQTFFSQDPASYVGPIAAKRIEINATGACVNPLCLRFDAAQAMYANRVNKARRNFRIVIKCSVCGFTYMRFASVRPNRWNILATGPLWDKKYRELLGRHSPSLRELRRQLGPFSLPTFQFHAVRLRLWNSRWSPASRRKAKAAIARVDRTEARREEMRVRCRRDWLNLRAEHPTLRITELASQLPKLYSWLYVNDRPWLDQHLPTHVPFVIARRRVVDYEQRDVAWAVLVARAAERIRARAGRPVRVTVEAIMHEAPLTGNVRRHFDKLPATAKMLQAVVETDEQFFERRLRAACRPFIAKREVPGHSALEALMGFSTASRQRHRGMVHAAVQSIRRFCEDNAPLPPPLHDLVSTSER